ncbi:UNVERIFIED_CONTAM: hypothetical protein GTU68_045297 [Idotea baltica]|nr:hypothetical protein [Idotea baltica]
MRGADPATTADLLRVHPQSYLDAFKQLSDADGGELGYHTPFGPGGYEIAAQSTGLVVQALRSVLTGELDNAYALTRPPGHHALPDYPNGFCLFANIAIAIEAARAEGTAKRFAVIDWDVHHGNGTEGIFYDRDDVLTVSLHQDRNYPMDQGKAEDRGEGAGRGFNLNVPLPPGSGHNTYLEAMERLALPAVRAFAPDVLIIACGFDAAALDPLGRMMCHTATYQAMTTQVMELAADVCDGRLVMAHEGGYSEVYVPFCGHAVLMEMAGSDITAPDPFGETWIRRQPNAEFDDFVSAQISRMATAADL